MPTRNEAPPARRPYDSTLRRERAAENRDRIIDAAVELLQGSSIRDWRALTVRAVAERAGVNERTVYRNFVNERGLRDAVMRRFEHEAGIDLEGLQLDEVEGVARRIFDQVSAYPLPARPALDSTLGETAQRQRDALRRAVSAGAPGWDDADQVLAAGMLDAVWAVASYERLVADWQLPPDEATRGITWVLGLIEAAVREGRRP